MPASELVCVLTTIQQPTECVRKLARAVTRGGGRLLVVGDCKTPASYDLPGVKLVTPSDQQQLPFRLAQHLAPESPSHKNLGYLAAMADGATCLYETDDDHQANEYWRPRRLEATAQRLGGTRWVNVYRAFTDQHVWPRGFPLELLQETRAQRWESSSAEQTVAAPIQQGLVDRAPDVDAIWRLVQGEELSFQRAPSVYLPPGTWCPFNSQSTWWWPAAFPLLYLPSNCSSRVSDIWRGFVAQRCLWELGHGLVFHAPEVIRERKSPRLLQDFQDEIQGYTHNAAVCRLLGGLGLQSGVQAVGENLHRCYAALIKVGLLPAEELLLVAAWLADIHEIQEKGRASSSAAA